MQLTKTKQKGTTLIETLVAASFFIVFSLAIYQLYAKMAELSVRIRTKTVATQIASEQIEFIRNLQYSDVGIVSGIPNGVIPQSKTVVRNNVTFSVETVIRNIDLPADGTLGGMPNDLSPSDNKLSVIKVTCTSCKTPIISEYTTAIAPKGLETENGNGAIVIKVIDASGLAVPNATVRIQNTSILPNIDFTDVTDNFGVLTIVDAPPSVESYHITVTKNGYSTEQTYIPGDSSNPNPVKPHLTVAANTVSQSTFSIDLNSSFDLRAQSPLCTSITGVSGQISGTKLIGTSPDNIKNVIDYTLNSVSNIINNIEWDTYSISLSGNTYDIAGINPIFPLSVVPGSSQQVTLTLKDATANNRLVVAVVDNNGLPISGADVSVVGPSGSFNSQTSVGSISQTDWSGGYGQTDFVDKTRFDSTDGGIDFSSTPGTIKLATAGADYVSLGEIISSSIDFGAPSVFGQLSWSPQFQVSGLGANAVKFQIATNDDNATWDFVGPDGTNSTFYTNAVSDISASSSNKRYLKYKIILSTSDTSKTPSITDVAITYTSGCLPPGQTDFANLSNGSYTITASKALYDNAVKNITISNNTYETIELSPQ